MNNKSYEQWRSEEEIAAEKKESEKQSKTPEKKEYDDYPHPDRLYLNVGDDGHRDFMDDDAII